MTFFLGGGDKTSVLNHFVSYIYKNLKNGEDKFASRNPFLQSNINFSEKKI